MNEIPLSVLFGALVVLLLLSGFFSGSETGLMTLNRYRLRHLAEKGSPGARLAARLLDQPDRLIGLILLGNNFVNILASSLTTLIALRLGGEGAVAVGAGLLTLVVLIFAEVAPKTLAALHPERLAFPAAFIYTPLLKLLAPVVWVINTLAYWVLRPLGVDRKTSASLSLSTEELRTVVNEAGSLIPRRHQEMLLSILDLEKVTVEDIMIPRGEIVGIDVEESWEEILRRLEESPYTKMPVYRHSIDNVIGMLHMRQVLPLMHQGSFSLEQLLEVVHKPYFIPETTSLNQQILNFQKARLRIGLVVNEYGDIEGLVTLEDILEEIIGEFTTDPQDMFEEIRPQEDGSYLVEGGVHIRDLNRGLGWHLPTDGPKTLNGLILEYLEAIPEPGTSLLIADHPVEIVQVAENKVKVARIRPKLHREGGSD
ncbi:MAG TPA: HlyC/CorC family transporter [Thiotrichales bacterium]|nr:HlyC/CorC family transporter [Thiotrichales bacterium]